jgi:hypothetical protein
VDDQIRAWVRVAHIDRRHLLQRGIDGDDLHLACTDVVAKVDQTNLVHDPDHASICANAQRAHLVDPFLATRVLSFNYADETCADRTDANETQDVALQTL